MDLAIVAINNIVVGEEEGSSSISDSRAILGVGLGLAGVDGESRRGELPEALGVVDGDFGELAGEGCVVDFTESVGAGGAVFEVGA